MTLTQGISMDKARASSAKAGGPILPVPEPHSFTFWVGDAFWRVECDDMAEWNEIADWFQAALARSRKAASPSKRVSSTRLMKISERELVGFNYRWPFADLSRFYFLD